MTEARQLAFDLPHRPALGRDDFIVSPANADAIAWLDRWPDWPAPGLVVHGPEGCGKTHLAHVWQARTEARMITPGDVTGERWGVLVERGATMILDGIEADLDEPALLHLYNRLVEADGALLLTGHEPPSAWAIALPDLASRLRALPSVAIEPPDDALLMAVLAKLFADRQLRVEHDVLRFLVTRMERSFASARACVAALDTAAFEKRRKVTVALAGEVLARVLPVQPDMTH